MTPAERRYTNADGSLDHDRARRDMQHLQARAFGRVMAGMIRSVLAVLRGRAARPVTPVRRG